METTHIANVVLLLVLAGCATQNQTAFHVISRPSVLDLNGTYPGTVTREFTMTANRSADNLYLSASCSCIEVVAPKGRFSLLKGQPNTARITCFTPSVEAILQTVYIRNEKHEAIGSVSLQGQATSALIGEPPRVQVVRRSNGSTGFAKFEVEVKPDLKVTSVESEGEQISVKRFSQFNKSLYIDVGLSHYLTDGPHKHSFRVKYSGEGGDGSELVPVRLDVASTIVLEPISSWLGSVAPAASLNAVIKVQSREAENNDKFKLIANSSDVNCVETKRTASTIEYTVIWKVPAEVGLTSINLSLQRDGETVANSTLSCSVTKDR